jgi:hypothetical protein
MRGRAFNLCLFATAYAAQGEPVLASAAGRQALDLTVRLTSAHSVRYVRDLVRALRQQQTSLRSGTSRRDVHERLPAAAGHAAPRIDAHSGCAPPAPLAHAARSAQAR